MPIDSDSNGSNSVYGYSRTNSAQMDRERVARQLLSGDDQRVEVGRQSPVNERQVANILEVRSQQLGRDASGPLAEIVTVTIRVANNNCLMPSTVRFSSSSNSARARSYSPVMNWHLAEHEQQCTRIDSVD